jgi:LPXTG-motif cell wall-anchored protein
MIARYALAALVAVVGLVFIGQGLGYIGGSGMTNQPFWAVVGAVMVVGAGVLAWSTRRSAT